MTLYRLLIVDDEEIITDSLYEVFARFNPDELDVCKAYTAREALQWMNRTRIDLVLTDIRMPGMNGLELTEQIQAHWPHCKVIFLTGYSEFDYAYRAMQLPGIRYVLKTEGYDKVIRTVEEAIGDIRRDHQLARLQEQSKEQELALRLLTQGNYLLDLLQDSPVPCDERTLLDDFQSLGLELDPAAPVVLVLGRLAYPANAAYRERNRLLIASKRIWESYLSGSVRRVGILDRYGDAVWFIQPAREEGEDGGLRLIRYLEGTLELVQEACLESVGVTASFAIGVPCRWQAITAQYDRLRQLQQAKGGGDLPMIVLERPALEGAAGTSESAVKEEFRLGPKLEILGAHLEANGKEKFEEVLKEVRDSVLQEYFPASRRSEAYYSIALLLLSTINRRNLLREVGECRKLMRLDDHASLQEAFEYLSRVAGRIFSVKQEEEPPSYVIDQLCTYIEENLNADLSLVRLAEKSYFNPTYLSRYFKQERGINLSEYIDQSRLRKAFELLRDESLKVREVAGAVGYESAHSFTRFFKKETGMTPQEYRDTCDPAGRAAHGRPLG
ncbi:response regulator transcription factor [Gorillibacterium sp. sgz500922]|uniref:response regulator transcription factor n=1 Tax=Gorillibacterium sp. sgz500922 TaxID=3446694 RepID=UPI003F677334